MADGAEFAAKLRLELENERELLKTLLEIAEKSGNSFDKRIVGSLKAAHKDAGRLLSALNLKNVEKQAEKLKASTAVIANNGARLAGQMQRAGAVKLSIFDKGKIRDAQSGLAKINREQAKMAEGWRKTSLHSQNVLRVIQDAPFGMLGMGNNIQVLTEDFARLRAEGMSIRDIAKTMFLPLVAGPMAISAIVTLITTLWTSWDKIEEKLTLVQEKLSGVAQGQRDLNEAIREFTSEDFFKSFSEGLEVDEDVDEFAIVSAKLRAEIDATQEKLVELGVVDPKALENRAKFMKTLMSLPLFGGSTGTDAATPGQQLAAQYLKLVDQLDTVTKARRKSLNEDMMRDRMGLETEGEQIDRERREKAAKEQAERLKKRAELERSLNLELAEEVDEMREQMEKDEIARMKRMDEEVRDQLKATLDEETRLRRAALEAEARMIQKIIGEARFKASMTRMGGDIPLPGDATRSQEAEHVRQQAQAEAEAIRIERDALREAAAASSDPDEREHLLQQAQLASQALINLERNTQAEITEINRQAVQERLSIMSGMSGALGGIFSDLGNIMGKETEKGFEQQKGWLVASATAEAIAASISVYRNAAAAGIANPLIAVQAGIQAAGVMTSLMAQIRKIRSMGKGGGDASFSGAASGSFTALNSNVVQQRAADFTQKQNQLRISGQSMEQESMMKALAEVGNKIADQKVILDEPTAAKATRAGDSRNTRRVQFSS